MFGRKPSTASGALGPPPGSPPIPLTRPPAGPWIVNMHNSGDKTDVTIVVTRERDRADFNIGYKYPAIKQSDPDFEIKHAANLAAAKRRVDVLNQRTDFELEAQPNANTFFCAECQEMKPQEYPDQYICDACKAKENPVS